MPTDTPGHAIDAGFAARDARLEQHDLDLTTLSQQYNAALLALGGVAKQVQALAPTPFKPVRRPYLFESWAGYSPRDPVRNPMGFRKVGDDSFLHESPENVTNFMGKIHKRGAYDHIYSNTNGYQGTNDPTWGSADMRGAAWGLDGTPHPAEVEASIKADQVLNPWRRRFIYGSCLVPTRMDGMNANGGWQVYDDANTAHRRIMLSMARSWFGLIDGVFFDLGADKDYKPQVLKLCDRLQGELGYQCGIEAFPRTGANDELGSPLDFDTMKRVPVIAHRSFVVNYYNGVTIPAECEAIVILSSKKPKDNSVPSEPDSKRVKAQGFTLASAGASFDQYLAA